MAHEAVRVHQQYRQCTLTELADLVLKTVEQRDENPDQLWQRWFVDYCLDALRPPPARTVSAKDWCRWLAFVLRYIQPLVTNNSPLETRPFIEVMHRRPDVLKTLMFGLPDAARLALQTAYELHVNERRRLVVPELSSDQQERFELVRRDVQQATDRTLTGWSRYYLDEGAALAKAIYNVFHPSPGAVVPEVLKLMEQPRRQQTLSGAKFDAYLARALQGPTESGFVGQALAYVNEFERRMNTLLAYSRLFRRASFLLLLFLVLGLVTVGISRSVVGNLVALIFLWLAVIDIFFVGLILVVIFFYAAESYTWTNTSLKTLEMLMGPVEIDDNR
jgi:hypothetical protein